MIENNKFEDIKCMIEVSTNSVEYLHLMLLYTCTTFTYY